MIVETGSLPHRMRVQCANAMEIAKYFADDDRVHVRYPGLETDPFHEVATRQLRDATTGEPLYGGMIGLEVQGDYEAFGNYFVKNPIITLCESLGSMQAILANPTTMSHRTLEDHERAELGIHPNLFRFSVGTGYAPTMIKEIDAGLQTANR